MQREIFNVLDQEAEVDQGDVRLEKDLILGTITGMYLKENGVHEKVPLKGYINFKDVSFGYEWLPKGS